MKSYMKYILSKFAIITTGAFLWNDPDQDQWSEITRIMVDQMNQWILVQSGFIGSFDLPFGFPVKWVQKFHIDDTVVLLLECINFGHATWEIFFKQSEAPPRS